MAFGIQIQLQVVMHIAIFLLSYMPQVSCMALKEKEASLSCDKDELNAFSTFRQHVESTKTYSGGLRSFFEIQGRSPDLFQNLKQDLLALDSFGSPIRFPYPSGDIFSPGLLSSAMRVFDLVYFFGPLDQAAIFDGSGGYGLEAILMDKLYSKNMWSWRRHFIVVDDAVAPLTSYALQKMNVKETELYSFHDWKEKFLYNQEAFQSLQETLKERGIVYVTSAWMSRMLPEEQKQFFQDILIPAKCVCFQFSRSTPAPFGDIELFPVFSLLEIRKICQEKGIQWREIQLLRDESIVTLILWPYTEEGGRVGGLLNTPTKP